jgi:hypothetical protein
MPGFEGPFFPYPFNFGGLSGIPHIHPGTPEGEFGPFYGQYPDTSHALIGAPKGMSLAPGTAAGHHAHPVPYYHPGVTFTDWGGHALHAHPHHAPHLHPGEAGVHQIHGGNVNDGSLLPGVDTGAATTSVVPMRGRKAGLKAQQGKLNNKKLAMKGGTSVFDFGPIGEEQGDGNDAFLALLACILPAAFLMFNPVALSTLAIVPPPLDPTKLLGAGATAAVNSLHSAGATAGAMVNVG